MNRTSLNEHDIVTSIPPAPDLQSAFSGSSTDVGPMDSSPMTSDDLSLPQTPAVGTFEENVIAFVEARKSIEDDGILGEVHTSFIDTTKITGNTDTAICGTTDEKNTCDNSDDDDDDLITFRGRPEYRADVADKKKKGGDKVKKGDKDKKDDGKTSTKDKKESKKSI